MVTGVGHARFRVEYYTSPYDGTAAVEWTLRLIKDGTESGGYWRMSGVISERDSDISSKEKVAELYDCIKKRGWI